MKAHKYQSNVQAKAAYLASRPKDSTYKVDETEDVFANPEAADGEADESEKRPPIARPMKKRKRKTTAERKKAKKAKTGSKDSGGVAED